MSRSVLLVVAVLLGALLLCSPVFSQDPQCFESGFDLYSVIGRTNQSINSSTVLLNISTQLNTSTYTATLPQSYAYGYLWIQVVVPSGATFNVTCNNNTLPVTFPYTAGGTFVQVAPIYALGAALYTNVIVISITNADGCLYSDTFNIINTPTALTPPGVRGDPMFAGLRGQQYQVHGMDRAVYNLISDQYTQVNSRFVFLSGPRPLPHHAQHRPPLVHVLVAPRLLPGRAGRQDIVRRAHLPAGRLGCGGLRAHHAEWAAGEGG